MKRKKSKTSGWSKSRARRDIRLLEAPSVETSIACVRRAPAAPAISNRNRIASLCNIDSDENFCRMFHDSSSSCEDRLGPPEHPSDHQCRTNQPLSRNGHTVLRFKGLFGRRRRAALTSPQADLDGAFSAPLFVHGDSGRDAFLHGLDMANDTNLTALGLQAFQCINSEV